MIRVIYVKDDFTIKKLNVIMHMILLENVLRKLDKYYDVKIVRKERYGDFDTSYKKTGKVINIVSKDKIEVEGYYQSNDPVYKTTYDEYTPVGISKILRDIFITTNVNKLSGLIKQLYDYAATDEEAILLDEAKCCFSFIEITKKSDFKTKLLNYEYGLNVNDVDMKYVEDNTPSKINNYPYIKTLLK